MRRQHRDVNGVWMHWRESGWGLPVILVHGLPTSPALWRHVMPRIAGGRCLAWEMVGYGSSILQGSRRDISVAQQATYLLQWLEALRIDRAVLVGHDLGGGVVQIAAARQPEVCAGLVLVNSIGYDAWPGLAVKLCRWLGPLIQRVPNWIFRFAFRQFLRLAHTSRADALEAMAQYWPHYAVYGPGAFVQQACALDLRDTRHVIARLQRLNSPMRVVWGAKDRFLPVEYGFRFARDLDATFQYIFKGRHFTPEDNPQVVAEAVNDVLAQLRIGEYPQHEELQRRWVNNKVPASL